MTGRRPRSVHLAEYKLFAGRLRSARKEAGLTQWVAADKLARPQSFVAKCESGERRVDAVELAKFAKLYRKRLSYFVSE